MKRVRCFLKVYANDKLPVLKTNFLKLTFLEIAKQLLRSFNLENVHLLSNPNVNLKNGVADKNKTFNKSKG